MTFDGICRSNASTAAAAAALIFIPSLPVLMKFFGPYPSFAYFVLLLLSIHAAQFCATQARAGNFAEEKAFWTAAVWLLFMTAAFAVLYPQAQAGIFGRGSDRDEALAIGVQALFDGRFPYYERTYLGGKLTPLPAAFAFAAPFHALGAVAVQNVFYTAVCVFILARLLRGVAVRWLFLALLTAANPAFMQDYVTGGDYALNGLYVVVCLTLCAVVVKNPAVGGVRFFACAAAMGFVVCTRPVYFVAVVVAAAFVFRRRGVGDGALFALVSSGVAALTTGPFILYDPAAFMPTHLVDKVPLSIGWLGAIGPVAALLVACAPLFKDCDEWDLAGLTGVSVACAVMPGVLPKMSTSLNALTYLAPAAVCCALYLFARRFRASLRG